MKDENSGPGWAIRSAVTALLLFAGITFAGEEPVIRSGSEEDFRPYCFTDDHGQPAGFGVELLQAVADRMGLRLRQTTGPWDKVWNELLTGQLDVLPVVARTPGRAAQVDFSLPHAETFDAFFVRTDRPPLNDLAAAMGKEIVVLRSDAAHHELIERKFTGKIIPVESIPEGLRLIAAGQHDAMLCSKLVGVFEREKSGIRGIRDGLPIPDYIRTFSFGVRKGDTKLLEKLNQGLLLVKADGTYAQIYRRWLKVEDPWERWLPYFKWAVGGLILLAVLSLVLQWLVHRRTRQFRELNARLEQRVEEHTATLRESQRQLSQQFAELAAIYETAPMGLCVLDRELRYRRINRRLAEMNGIPAEEHIGRTVREVVPSLTEQAEESLRRVLETGRAVQFEFHGETPAQPGVQRIWDEQWYPLRDAANNIVGVGIVAEEVTERRKTEQALRESEALLSAVMMQVPVGLGVMDMSGKWIVTNSIMKEFVPDAIPSTIPEHTKRWRTWDAHGREIPPENWPGKRALRGETVTPGLDMLFMDDNGRERWMRMSTAPLRDDAGQIIGAIGVVQDIDQIKRAQDSVRESGMRLSGLINSAMDAIITVDESQRIVLFNPAAEKMFGCSAAQALESPLDRFIPLRFREAHHQHIGKFGQTGVTTRRMGALGALSGLRSNGEEFPIEASISHMEVGGKKLFTVILRDVTEQKEAEENLQQARRKLLLHAAELEATVAERTAKLEEMVDELQHVSYAIAHDMRAPLRAMGLFATLLLEEGVAAGSMSRSEDYCHRIITAAARLDKLIQDALHYTKLVQQEAPVGPVNLMKLVRDLIESYPNLHPGQADIVIENELPLVLGNGAMLTQCFSNLLGNAVKFVAPGVRPMVRVRAEMRDGRVRVSVADNGIGIPHNAQARLFKMFQKLDAEYEGTGIGLAIVRKVVERLGGNVGVDSEPGNGSCFWVELPLANPGHEGRIQPA